MSRFEERLRNGPPIVADGGLGALVSSAVPGLRCPEEANVRAPESVVAVHVSYIQAGAELIETNTFGANRRKLRALYLETELEAINSGGVKLAREAREIAGRDVFIAGSIGPLGDVDDHEDERAALFAEQAALLEGRGVDLFMVETFYDLDELVTAVEAVRGVSSLPIVALLTFDTDGETFGGVTARDAAARLHELRVAAVGANHGDGPQAALEALSGMQTQKNGLPLAALPNLGLASRWGNRIVYPHSDPEYFAEFAAHARDLGAKLIGGCCGTTPVQIAAIARALAEERRAVAPLEHVERDLLQPTVERMGDTALAAALREGRWVTTVEIDPPRGWNNAGMLDSVRRLRESGLVDFVDINDNATARATMSSLLSAVEIERATEMETVPHLTSRDMTIMGLESSLLGAHAAGVRNILAITGDPPSVGDYPGSQGVYEIDSIGLCQLLRHLNDGVSYAGKGIDSPTSFFYGVALNPTADDLDEELRRFEQKLEAGAQFVVTQVLFDLAFLDELERRYGQPWPVPVIAGLFFVRSYTMALRLHNEIPGIVVPERIQERFRAAGNAGLEAGREIARALVAEARERALAGVQIIPPYKAPLAALEVLAP